MRVDVRVTGGVCEIFGLGVDYIEKHVSFYRKVFRE